MYVLLEYSLKKLMEKIMFGSGVNLDVILFYSIFVCEVYQMRNMHVFILIPIKAIRGSSKYEKKIMELHTYLYIYVHADILTFGH